MWYVIQYFFRYPVHLAAAHGRNAVLDFLYTYHQVDLDVRDNFGMTPMLEAVQHSRKETVAWLRKRGVMLCIADDQEQAKAAVFDICSKGDMPTLELYVQSGIDFDFTDYDLRTPLMIAASDGNELVVDELLKARADPLKVDRWGQTALDCAKDGGHIECVELLAEGYSAPVPIADSTEKTPLTDRRRNLLEMVGKYSSLQSIKGGRTVDQHARSICTAAAEGNVPELQRLVNKSVDANSCDYDSRTPLHIASAAGHLDAVKFLCSMSNINVNAMDRWHATPLRDSVRQGHIEVASLLRSKGAVTINRNLGYRLCSAAATGNIDELKQCLDEGVNLNAADYDARTAMHLAACNGQLEVIKFLLANGAFVSPRDRYNLAPLDDAERENQQEVISYLRDYIENDAGSDQHERTKSTSIKEEPTGIWE